MLSTLAVLNTLDTAFPSPGDGSLRGEIAAAASGDTIVFDPSLSGQTIQLYHGELQIAKNLTIQGPGAGQLTIDGGGYGYYGSRIFEIDGATTTVSISGLTLSGGNGTAYHPDSSGNVAWGAGGNHTTTLMASDLQGGAIFNAGTLTLSGCSLINNSADMYGGYYYSSSVVAGYGGGAIFNIGTLTIQNSTLSYNSAGDPYGNYFGDGGAIYNAGTLIVNSSTLSHNSAWGTGNSSGGNGGGIYNGGTLTVTGSILSDNSAYDGGGIFNAYRMTATVSSNTFSHNDAWGRGSNSGGGAIYSDGLLTVTGSAISGNSAYWAAGGIYNAKHGKLTIQSSVVTNNGAPLGADLYNLGSVKISKDSTVVLVGP